MKLMKQVKEEAERSKQSEARRTREVGQMKREQMKKESLIKTLEREKYQKEIILRRKQEEVNAVKQNTQPAPQEKKPTKKTQSSSVNVLLLMELCFVWICSSKSINDVKFNKK